MFRASICLFFLLTFFVDAIAFTNPYLKEDTSLSISARTVSFSEKDFDEDKTSLIDTSLSLFNRYLPFFYAANNGLAKVDWYRRETFNKDELGFRFFKENYFSNYFYSHTGANYCITKSPYTDLSIVVGAKKEQFFSGTHSQNINKNFNITADFKRIRSEGWFLRQATDHTSIHFSGNYKNTNQHYFLFFDGAYNSAKLSENGGIAEDSLFENGNFTDKKVIPVRLNSAQRRIRNKYLYVRQDFVLRKQKKDSVLRDPSRSRISHSLFLEDNQWIYTDNKPDESYYPFFYYDKSKTYDSLRFFKVENSLYWKLRQKSKNDLLEKGIGGSIGLVHQLIRVKQNELDSVFQCFRLTGNVFNYNQRKIGLTANASYVLTGFNSGDYLVGIAIDKKINENKQVFRLTGNFENRSADFFYQSYLSNHFFWKNSFSKTKNLFAKISYLYTSKIDVGVEYQQYSNYLYLDHYALPKQIKSQVYFFSTYIKNKFRLEKLNFSNEIRYTGVEKKGIIRIPNLYLNTAVYYENEVFKKALLFQVGIDVFYFSSFYANAYMPVLAQYYLQNEKQIGNYPFLDFFVNMKIKRVKIFIQMAHANAGINRNTYYIAPNTPLYGRSFKVGINWKFYN